MFVLSGESLQVLSEMPVFPELWSYTQLSQETCSTHLHSLKLDSRFEICLCYVTFHSKNLCSWVVMNHRNPVFVGFHISHVALGVLYCLEHLSRMSCVSP